ncbi:Lrp/AsnC family transcriptional regulator [Larkinella soli]|uniref:Lrp/AsnC family transcriptional regulator n=1 Tax=Larkinella soli TaxID=1770527 RepID=UPI000FFBBD9C|nr:Lrp/AsnC family transcriptional regulator [Larkinella soli]
MATPLEQTTPGPPALDEKDLEILRLLQNDAKLTVRDIASRIHLSATPTHERIKRLEKLGVIRQYAALLDHRMVNRGIMVLCQITLKDHDRKTARGFIEAVMQFEEVIECYNISGEFDFLLKIVTGSMESYHHFIVNHLNEIRGIGQTKSSFVMDTVKQTHRLI